MTNRCTEQFLALTFLGATCQLLTNTSPLDFGRGTVAPTVFFSLSELGVPGQCESKVRLEVLDGDFAIVSLTTNVPSGVFTPVLRRTLGLVDEDRRVVEMSCDAGTLLYRLDRSLFTEAITCHIG